MFEMVQYHCCLPSGGDGGMGDAVENGIHGNETGRKGCDGDGVAVAETVFPPCGGTAKCSCIKA